MTGDRLPPGSFGLPLFGETLAFLSDIHFQQNRYQKYGSIFRTHLFGRPTPVMMGAEANRFVLSTGLDYLSWREGWPSSYRVLFGESLFMQDGEEHRQKRKLLMPAFHREVLQEYIGTMQSITERYLHQWEREETFAWINRSC